MLTQEEYFAHRAQCTANLDALENLERRVMNFLVEVVASSAPQLHDDGFPIRPNKGDALRLAILNPGAKSEKNRCLSTCCGL